MRTAAAPWAYRLDEVAADVLEQAGIAGPPVDALRVAERLHILVVLDATQHGRARHKRLGGSSSIFLKPDERPERLQWAAAHELGEVFAYRIAEQIDVDDPATGVREQIASQIASRLLLPRGWFFADAVLLDGDLFALKKRYSTASHELIAWRLLDLPEPSIVSIFDQGRLMRRRAQPGGQSPPLSPIERACWCHVHQAGTPLQQTVGSLRVQAWPVHEPHWKREILRTRPADGD